MRPTSLQHYIGQSHILSPNSVLYRAIESGRCHSLIVWGPPGVGKTTLAELIAHYGDAELIKLSAVSAGIKEVREAVLDAKNRLAQQQKRTLLFVDEVHRFNKSQQDAFLPHIEDGTFIFIGRIQTHSSRPHEAHQDQARAGARLVTAHAAGRGRWAGALHPNGLPAHSVARTRTPGADAGVVRGGGLHCSQRRGQRPLRVHILPTNRE